MENNERDRKLDQWLDEALSQYSAAEPRLGLEQRVIAQVRSEEQARAERRNWWRWMPAFAAIAAVLIVVAAVKPYWASKTEPMSTYISTPAPMQNQAAETGNEVESKSPDNSAVARAMKAVPAMADSRAKEEPTTTLAPMRTKDAAISEKREAAVKPREQTLPTSKANRNGTYAANLNAPARDSDTAEKKPEPTLQSIAPIVAAAPAASAPMASGASGGVVGGTIAGSVTNGRAGKVAAEPRTPTTVQMQSETVEVQSAAQTVETQNRIIATERVKVPDVSTQLRTIKLKPKGALAKKLGEDVSGGDLGFTMLRIDLKHVPPGPVQQFPTLVPLSKEEEMMPAAAKQFRGKPANQEKNDGGIPAIEIKKLEIAPLAGPPK